MMIQKLALTPCLPNPLHWSDHQHSRMQTLIMRGVGEQGDRELLTIAMLMVKGATARLDSEPDAAAIIFQLLAPLSR